VEDHFAFEERELFPVLAAEGEEGHRHVHALLGDHALIRRALIDLGVALQTGDDLEASLARVEVELSKHEAREDDWLHPAAERMARSRGVTGVKVGLWAGAAAGGIVGVIAGPAGVVVGAAIGGAVGAITARAMDVADHDRGERDAALDEAIGVTAGHIGEASPDAPKAKIGAFHPASLGLGGGDDVETVDGPIPSAEGEGLPLGDHAAVARKRRHTEGFTGRSEAWKTSSALPFIAFVRDVTELRRLQREEARAADRTRRLHAVAAALSGAVDVGEVATVVLSAGLTAVGAASGLLARVVGGAARSRLSARSMARRRTTCGASRRSRARALGSNREAGASASPSTRRFPSATWCAIKGHCGSAT
jgi:hypothetical protein